MKCSIWRARKLSCWAGSWPDNWTPSFGRTFKCKPSFLGERLRTRPGRGLSTVARAGLVAALKQDAIPGSAGWPVTIFRPGPDPVESLALALSRALNLAQRPTVLLAAKTYGSVFYDKLTPSIVRRKCSTIFGQIDAGMCAGARNH
jgi:hypothetical protein